MKVDVNGLIDCFWYNMGKGFFKKQNAKFLKEELKKYIHELETEHRYMKELLIEHGLYNISKEEK